MAFVKVPTGAPKRLINFRRMHSLDLIQGHSFCNQSGDSGVPVVGSFAVECNRMSATKSTGDNRRVFHAVKLQPHGDRRRKI